MLATILFLKSVVSSQSIYFHIVLKGGLLVKNVNRLTNARTFGQ
jgi:hypothetical protein